MGKISDERAKLTATFMNGVAIAMVAAGAIAPLVALSYGVPGATGSKWLALIGLSWVIIGVALHLVARWSLRRLKE